MVWADTALRRKRHRYVIVTRTATTGRDRINDKLNILHFAKYLETRGGKCSIPHPPPPHSIAVRFQMVSKSLVHYNIARILQLTKRL